MADQYICSACGFAIPWPVDICEDCGKEFGDSGEDANGINSTCVHCGGTEYFRCCPNCEAPVNEEEWEIVEDQLLAEEAKR